MKLIAFDLETTGLDASDDEILQFSAVCYWTGSALSPYPVQNSYYKPVHHAAWPDAERVNHITPDAVALKPHFRSDVMGISELLSTADAVIAYNASFDLGFLRSAGVLFKAPLHVYDPMIDFARYRGIPDDRHGGYRWHRLSDACEYIGLKGVDPDGFHDACWDAIAALEVWRWLDARSANHVIRWEWSTCQR